MSEEKQVISRVNSFEKFQGSKDIFVGNVSISMMFKSNSWRNYSGALVEFEPKSRTAWHTHPAGQTLIVTEGEIITKAINQEPSIAKKAM